MLSRFPAVQDSGGSVDGSRVFLLRFPPARGGFLGASVSGFHRSWTITAGQCRLWYQSTGLLGGKGGVDGKK